MAQTRRFTRLFYLASSLVALAACKKNHAPPAEPVPIATRSAA
jgi:hypothetical protein